MNRAWPLLLVALVGCVTQGKYDALQKSLDDTRAELTGKMKNADKKHLDETTSLQASLDKEWQRANALEQERARLDAELQTAQKAKAALEQDHTVMLKDKSRLQASVEEMKTALADLARRKAEADKRIAEFKGLLERFRSLIDAGKLQVKIADGRMVVELASDVLFASGSATLSKDGKASIAEVAGLLASIPERKFQVEGHTDNVPIRSAAFPSNWELASARALTVLKTMVEAGMPAERISAASFGDSKPARPNDTAEGKAANRRIEIVVVPDLSSLPGFEELKRASTQ